MNNEFKNEPPESIRDKVSGSTTLKQCGWCKYATGNHRVNYCISGECRLQSYGSDIKWDTPCQIIKLGKKDVNNLIHQKSSEIDDLIRNIESKKDHIMELMEIMETCKDSPVLPENRSTDHFSLEDLMVIHFHPENETPYWISGTVKRGYRHRDGAVSYMLAENTGPQEQPFWGSGIGIGSVMLLHEALYLYENPDEASSWFTSSGFDTNTLDAFIKFMEKNYGS